MLFITAALALQLELVRHSLAGTHYRYRQVIGGQPVVGGEVNLTVRPDGTTEETRNVCEAPPTSIAAGAVVAPFIVNVRGVAHYANRVEANRVVRYIDTESGEVIRVEPRFAGAKAARVFDANPVKKLNDPSLQDQNNAASAVPDTAYTTVELDDVNGSGPLGGPYCQIIDLQPPAVPPAGAAGPLLFDRSQPGFEDVNAYFHVDRSQRYLQSLGYTGQKGVAQYPVPVDTHAANGSDSSFFIPSLTIGEGTLIFGDGGTDDAEDPDLVNHEYAHALHEWIAPGTFLGPFASEGRAISEGFADYWAFSASYEVSLQSGRDPFCFADWDARCWNDASSEQCAYPAGADCLRRLDSARTIADFDHNESNGTQYLNGEIWSSALREIFVALTQRYGVGDGRRVADTIAVESLFGAPPDPSFAGIARRMIAADRDLYRGANADVICAAMTQRGILDGCVTVPRGELTVFESGDRAVPIPDDDAGGISSSVFLSDWRSIDKLYVQINVSHPVRGDLRIALVGPDGTTVLLKDQSNDRTSGIHATYGRDSLPAQSLDVFHGQPARGEWRLEVSDLRPRDAGTLMSWSLVVQFAGDGPAVARPTAAPRQFIPVAGRVPGANGTFFTTDLRLLNRRSRDVTAMVIFTPDGADGRTDFAAVQVSVPADAVVALPDIAGTTFGTAGLGQLEIDGDVVAVSRTYTRRGDGGTLGESIAPSAGARAGTLIRLSDTSEVRTNIGFAETAGNGGSVYLRLFDAVSGAHVADEMLPIQPYGHLQIPVTAAASMTARFESTTDVAGYASIIDNVSGDATIVVASSGQPESGLAPAISATGALGTRWTTDVWVSGPATLTYVDAITLRADTVTITPQPQTYFPDIVRLTFHGVRGVISATGADLSETIANDGFRQSVAFLMPVEATQDLAYVERSSAFRTNVGLMSDEAVSVRVTLLDASGRELSSSIHALEPLQLDQFTIVEPVVDGHVRIEALSGRVAAYASVVDNITGDASFVPAR